jgi:hypothetical protein
MEALILLQHLDQMEKLRRDPSLIKSAVEELLRFTAPVFMSTERYAQKFSGVAAVASESHLARAGIAADEILTAPLRGLRSAWR